MHLLLFYDTIYYEAYATAPRLLKDFDYDVLVKFDSKWKVQNQLKGKTFYQMVCELKKGGYEELEMYGWLTKLEYMKTLGQIRRINQQSRFIKEMARKRNRKHKAEW